MLDQKDVASRFIELRDIMRRLRAPGGCPWDRKQTYLSLRPYIKEEAYELVDAIDSGDLDSMAEEAGDLLLQVVFIATIAEEMGDFSLSDVIKSISDKLIRRHPHVFSDLNVDSSEEVLKNWEEIKRKEKEVKKVDTSLLSGVPKSLPPLVKSYRIQEKAAAVGFDWPNGEEKPVFDKIQEEITELKEAMDEGDKSKMEDELGDVLFSVVNLARRLKIDPEGALERTNRKFKDRFTLLEEKVNDSDRDWTTFSLKELDDLWNYAKSML